MKDMKMEHEHHKFTHSEHHRHMMEDFKIRFVISSLLTIPILLLSPLIQRFFGFTFTFPGDVYVLFLFSAIVYFYGGKPFLVGMWKEMKQKNPGMMTPIAIAITVAFFLQCGGEFWIAGKNILLGTGNSYRHYASWPLHRDAFCAGCLQGT